MKIPLCCMNAIALVVALANLVVADEPVKIAGLGPTGPVRKVHGDFKFTEGPASDGQGKLYFTDVPASRIYRVDSDGRLDIFLEPSGTANGLMFNATGKLVACQMEGRLVEIEIASKEVNVLAEKFADQRFNAPNDLVIDSQGGIYFTDPRFRAPMPLPQKEAWYYRTPAGEVQRLGDDLPAPNGVILSPDEKTLYVIPSMQKQMMAYPVQKPGVLGEGRIFCELKQANEIENRGGDGLTVDTLGNLYITSNLGLQVFSPAGKALGIIAFPEQPSNCTFGGPAHKTLFVTARTSLYAVDMEVAGHRFATGKQGAEK